MTSERIFDRKKRNTGARKQKPIILIVAEGRNVTESQYFMSFQRQNSKCNIRVIIAKHTTDPRGMLKALQQKWRDLGLDSKKGDKAYVVMDLDCSNDKAELIARLKNKSGDIEFIVSNPCFEVWFLLHYRYSTKQYYSSEAVIKDLKTLIPDYEKNLDIADRLVPMNKTAINNAAMLRHHFDELGYKWPSNDCNPRTDVDFIVRKILEDIPNQIQ